MAERLKSTAFDLEQERKQAHALLDQLSPAKLAAVRSLLEVMLDDDELPEFGMKPEDFPLSKSGRPQASSPT